MTDPNQSKAGSQTPARPGPAERPTSEESIAHTPSSRSRRVSSAHYEESESSRAWVWGVIALIALIAGGAIWMSLGPEGEEEAQVLEQAAEDINTPPGEIPPEVAPPPEAPAPTEAAPAAEAPGEVEEEVAIEERVSPEVEPEVAAPTPEAPPAPSEPAAEAPPPEPAVAAVEPPPPPPAEPAAAPDTYTVARGDTLGKIAAKLYGDSNKWREIAEANPGMNVNRLRVGQVIKLPSDLPMEQQ